MPQESDRLSEHKKKPQGSEDSDIVICEKFTEPKRIPMIIALNAICVIHLTLE